MPRRFLLRSLIWSWVGRRRAWFHFPQDWSKKKPPPPYAHMHKTFSPVWIAFNRNCNNGFFSIVFIFCGCSQVLKFTTQKETPELENTLWRYCNLNYIYKKIHWKQSPYSHTLEGWDGSFCILNMTGPPSNWFLISLISPEDVCSSSYIVHFPPPVCFRHYLVINLLPLQHRRRSSVGRYCF